MGCPTELSRQIADELGATTVGTAVPCIATDAVRRAWYGHGANRRAKLFLAPDSMDQMRAIAAAIRRSWMP